MATDSNELGKGGKGNEEKWWREENVGMATSWEKEENWWREEKVGMATDSDRLERAKHWDETADDR